MPPVNLGAGLHQWLGRPLYPHLSQRIDRVVVEQAEAGLRPDLKCFVGDSCYYIEILVTHEVDQDKQAQVHENGWTMLEIDLSDLPREEGRINENIVRDRIQVSHARKRWVHHAEASALTAQLGRYAAELRYIGDQCPHGLGSVGPASIRRQQWVSTDFAPCASCPCFASVESAGIKCFGLSNLTSLADLPDLAKGRELTPPTFFATAREAQKAELIRINELQRFRAQARQLDNILPAAPYCAPKVDARFRASPTDSPQGGLTCAAQPTGGSEGATEEVLGPPVSPEEVSSVLQSMEHTLLADYKANPSEAGISVVVFVLLSPPGATNSIIYERVYRVGADNHSELPPAQIPRLSAYRRGFLFPRANDIMLSLDFCDGRQLDWTFERIPAVESTVPE
jgi:hypothetical protein